MASSPATPPRTSGGTATYQIDPSHSVAEFVVKHLMFSTVKGRFAKVGGEIKVDEANPTNSSVAAEADVASVETGDPKRDGHLRSPDFFEVEKYPTLTFNSRRVERTGGDDTYRVVGDLTIRDVTREVALDTTYLGQGTDPWGGTRVGFSATTTINRKDFGLNWNAPLETGGVLVSDQVRINLEIQAVKKS